MLFSAAVLICSLATGLAQSTVSSPDGSVTYTCPNSITPEVVYSTASSVDQLSCADHQVPVKAGNDGIIQDDITYAYNVGPAAEGRVTFYAK
jgi:hypothetical protein